MELSLAQLERLAQNTLKGRNVNNVTHDLNNLFGAIMAYTELIQMDTTDPETNRMLGEILGAVEKGAETLSALTVITRALRNDTLVMSNVSDIFSAINLLFVYEFKLGLVDARFEADDGVGEVRIDDSRLQQVLMHVIANALEALSDCEEKKLTVRASLDGSNVSIIVQNSGAVIEEALRNRIFDAGFTTKDDGHLGMGLTVSQSFLASANGSIAYEPENGFKILVPKAD